MKIATELHRPKWVSLPLVDAILRDDVLISFITPPEFQTEPTNLYVITFPLEPHFRFLIYPGVSEKREARSNEQDCVSIKYFHKKFCLLENIFYICNVFQWKVF